MLAQLRAVLQGQADAISTDDFDGLARLSEAREPLVSLLAQYTAADLGPEEHLLAEQLGALDQQVMALAQESQARTGQELRGIHRGRSALTEYARRGQTLIRNLAYLGQQDAAPDGG
ncbi:MAG: flagellar protein FliT [Chloroflexota bacterium]